MPSLASTLSLGSLLLSTLSHHASADTVYSLAENYAGDSFFDNFDFFNQQDPTNGFVTYVDQATAQSEQLVKVQDGKAYLGVDSTSVLAADGPGRKSVRIETKKSFTHGLFVADIAHMPKAACGVWPAFWSVGGDWPNNGEINIVESINLDKTVLQALHTANDCSITGNGQAGRMSTPNCKVGDSTVGCAVRSDDTHTIGADFNAGEGGAYVMEWTSDFIKMWFFPRSAMPASITAGNPNPAEFGHPISNFQGSCDIDANFKEHKFIFNTVFCGDWAGGEYNKTESCPVTSSGYGPITSNDACVAHVASSPAEFQETYWLINSLGIYSASEGSVSSSAPLPPAPTEGYGAIPVSESSESYPSPEPVSDEGEAYPEPAPSEEESYPEPTPNDGESSPEPTASEGESYPEPTPSEGESYPEPSPTEAETPPAESEIPNDGESCEPDYGNEDEEDSCEGETNPGESTALLPTDVSSEAPVPTPSDAGSSAVLPTDVSSAVSSDIVLPPPVLITSVPEITATAVLPTDVASSDLTTATLSITETLTITSCAPEVPDCPASAGPTVITTIHTTVTVCPISELPNITAALSTIFSSVLSPVESSAAEVPIPEITSPVETAIVPSPEITAPPAASELTTLTLSITETQTITSCAPEVPDCPASAGPTVITTVHTTVTICPISEVPSITADISTLLPIFSSAIDTVVPVPPETSEVLPAPSSEAPPAETPALTSAAPSEVITPPPDVATLPASEITTLTLSITDVQTITTCAPEVPDCPAATAPTVTTVIHVTTTICPITEVPQITENPITLITPGTSNVLPIPSEGPPAPPGEEPTTPAFTYSPPTESGAVPPPPAGEETPIVPPVPEPSTPGSPPDTPPVPEPSTPGSPPEAPPAPEPSTPGSPEAPPAPEPSTPGSPPPDAPPAPIPSPTDALPPPILDTSAPPTPTAVPGLPSTPGEPCVPMPFGPPGACQTSLLPVTTTRVPSTPIGTPPPAFTGAAVRNAGSVGMSVVAAVGIVAGLL